MYLWLQIAPNLKQKPLGEKQSKTINKIQKNQQQKQYFFVIVRSVLLE